MANLLQIGTGYPDCKLEFLNIDNIHVIRKCHTTLQFIMEERLEGPNWYSLVESSGWLAQVRLILLGAVRVVEVIENEAASVLVHCSDGWDRTSQVGAFLSSYSFLSLSSHGYLSGLCTESNHALPAF